MFMSANLIVFFLIVLNITSNVSFAFERVPQQSHHSRYGNFNKLYSVDSNINGNSQSDSFDALAVATHPRTSKSPSLFKRINRALFETTITYTLILLTGATTAFYVTKIKEIIVFLEGFRKQYPSPLPVVGGILIAFFYLVRKDLNSTGPAALYQEYVLYFRQLFRVLAVLIAVGTGNSLAMVGIVAELGMTVGRFYLSMYIALVHLIDHHHDFKYEIWYEHHIKAKLVPIMCAAGAAAGVAANFDAPFVGALYALEITRRLDPTRTPLSSTTSQSKPNPLAKVINTIKYTLSHNLAGHETTVKQNQWPVILAVFFSAFVSVFSIRRNIQWSPTAPHFLSKFFYHKADFGFINTAALTRKLSQCAVLGVLSGLVASLFEWTRDIFTHLFRQLPTSDFRLGVVIASAACSMLSYFQRHQSLLLGGMMWRQIVSGELSNALFLFGFFVERLLAVAMCNASGLLGGVFTPSLFIGSSFGAFIYSWVSTTVPNVPAEFLLNRSMFALLGAAGVLSGMFRAPFTAAVFLLELTSQINLALPLVVTASVASNIATRATQYRLWKEKEREESKHHNHGHHSVTAASSKHA